MDNYKVAWPLLAERNMTATIFGTTSLIGGASPPPPWQDSGLKFEGMTEKHLIELGEAGIEIASHGVNHFVMTQLSDDALQKELHNSKERLEQILGRPVTNLSYPHGIHDSRIEGAAKDAGYLCAWSCRQSPVMSNENPFALPRCSMHPNVAGPSQFEVLMNDGDLVGKLRRFLSGSSTNSDGIPLPPENMRAEGILR
jgi:peptidoglycan/xylan/chitin deacetylase (PgdA/CDA1 family)